MLDVMIFASTLTVIVIAIVEMIKQTADKKLPKNLVPFISFIVGLIVGTAAYPFTELALDMRLWAGAFAGLAATGLFELAFNPRSNDDPKSIYKHYP